MSEMGSQNALVPVVPQGQMEVAARQGQGQGELPSYEELLRLYVDTRQQPMRLTPPMLSYEELQEFYVTHDGQAFVPQLPAPANAAGAIIVEDDVVTREEVA